MNGSGISRRNRSRFALKYGWPIANMEKILRKYKLIPQGFLHCFWLFKYCNSCQLRLKRNNSLKIKPFKWHSGMGPRHVGQVKTKETTKVQNKRKVFLWRPLSNVSFETTLCEWNTFLDTEEWGWDSETLKTGQKARKLQNLSFEYKLTRKVSNEIWFS